MKKITYPYDEIIDKAMNSNLLNGYILKPLFNFRLIIGIFLFSCFANAQDYSINYMATVNGAIVGDGTTNTDYFGPNNWGGTYGDCTSGILPAKVQ